jgi:hypothetical protein
MIEQASSLMVATVSCTLSGAIHWTRGRWSESAGRGFERLPLLEKMFAPTQDTGPSETLSRRAGSHLDG